MNPSQRRKIGYLLSMVASFTLLLWVSKSAIEPAAEKHQLAQKSLGKVDPISGTAQLVFLGFRGVAVTFLWNEAQDLQKKERFFEIRPVVESISLLQPNFVSPCFFQAWNMAYNIAAEWEAVKDKYFWIRQGIDYLKKSIEINRNVSELEWSVGWYYHNRFGMSDEKTYLRQLLRRDPDDSFSVPPQLSFDTDVSTEKDNFEIAYSWFSRANDTVRRRGKRPKTMGITPFMSNAGRSKLSYADFLAQEGTFGEKTRNAWRRARDKWVEFGRDGEPGRDVFIHKLDFTAEEWEGQRLCSISGPWQADLDRGELSAGLVREIESYAGALPAGASVKIEEAGAEWRIGDGPNSYCVRKQDGQFVVYKGGLTREKKYWAQHYGNIVHYTYWKKRATVEATAEMQAAREGFYLARQALQKADYQKAVELYESTFPKWREMVKRDESLRGDTVEIMRDTQEHEERYLRLKRRLDQPLPESLRPRPMEGIFPALEVEARATPASTSAPPTPPGGPTPAGPAPLKK
jgi:hypothetical protein